MMRKVIMATLALSPLLLHAQVNSPAQPQSSSNTSTLQSTNIQPKAFSTDGADHGIVAPLRISTGVVAPKLVYTEAIATDTDLTGWIFPSDRSIVVAMTVDTNGKPSDMKIVQSVNPIMDQNVLEAVSHYRFTPGTLDDQPTPVQLNLEIVLHHPSL
jgi:TonB family protein